MSNREPNDYVWGASANARDRYILLDLGPDATLVIDIGTSEGDFDALIAEAMPIVESFTFD